MTRALRIALADDERDTREYLGQLLTRLGHQVVSASTGQQLVELAKVGEPDLIITDIKMPDLDGIDAAELINQQRETPAILVTGHHNAELLKRVTGTHVMAYLVKPIEPPDVEAAIAVALARFEQYREVRREAADLRQALEDRKLIERAKGAVMKRLRVDEDEAFRRLRHVANDAGQKVVEVARKVLAAEEIYQQLEGG
jgi:response regulator NasT